MTEFSKGQIDTGSSISLPQAQDVVPSDVALLGVRSHIADLVDRLSLNPTSFRARAALASSTAGGLVPSVLPFKLNILQEEFSRGLGKIGTADCASQQATSTVAQAFLRVGKAFLESALTEVVKPPSLDSESTQHNVSTQNSAVSDAEWFDAIVKAGTVEEFIDASPRLWKIFSTGSWDLLSEVEGRLSQWSVPADMSSPDQAIRHFYFQLFESRFVEATYKKAEPGYKALVEHCLPLLRKIEAATDGAQADEVPWTFQRTVLEQGGLITFDPNQNGGRYFVTDLGQAALMVHAEQGETELSQQ